MPRTLPKGTPTRATRYLFPPSHARRWAIASALGGLVVAAVTTLFFAGVTPVASPGTLTAAHASVDTACVQCHQPAHAVTDLRCERCHDVGGSDRFTNGAHVLYGSLDASKADRADVVACVQCHAEHRGREWGIAAVDDRECATCHQFGSLDRHPQFAAVNAGITTGLDLKFDHDRHLVEVVGAGLAQCESCHAPTVDQVGFEPITFEQQCQACHVDDNGFVTGRTDPISPDDVLMPDQIPEAWAGSSQIQAQPAARGRLEFGQMRHRDPWTLYNARRLRRAIDPEGEAIEREALRGRIVYLEQQLAVQPLDAVPTTQLASWAGALAGEVSTLAARAAEDDAAGRDPDQTASALVRMAAAARALASTVANAEPSVQEAADAIAGQEIDVSATDAALAEAGIDQGGADAETFERRRAELASVLDSIADRGDPELAERATALRTRVDALRPGSTGADDTARYRDALNALGEIVRVIRDVPDAQAQFEAAQLNVLRAVARQQIIGGLPVDEVEERRRQLLSLLTAVDASGDADLRVRSALLRQRVLAARAGEDGNDARRRQLRRRQKDLARVELELELAAAGQPAPVRAAAPVRDRRAVEGSLAIARARLTRLDSGSRPGEALTDDDLARASNALKSLLGPCLKCHELSGPTLAPVTVAEPVMPRARFDHAPHVILADCASCHDSVATSGLATDINVPAVESCRSCHRPNEARADCAGCHVYHPPSVASLLGER